MTRRGGRAAGAPAREAGRPRFEARVERLSDRINQYRLLDGGAPLRYADVIDHWRRADDAFRRFFIELLDAAPFSCFRFETPPVTRSSLSRPFELVLVDSPEIDMPPDSRDFQAHFDARDDEILVFDNLGGDAMMVVPRPRHDAPGYAHIAAFIDHAPLSQQLSLWRAVGETMHARLGDAPLWLSTAGGGVPWLHVRLDSRPKYYVFDDYRL